MRRVISIAAATGAATAVAALAGIAGCASSTGTATGSTTSTSTGGTTSTLTLPHANCGSASGHNLSARTQLFRVDPPGALTCFTMAAKACKAVGLHVTEMGVDTGTYWVFVIASGGSPGRCTVTEYSQAFSAIDIGGLYTQSPNGWVQAVKTAQCRETSVTSKGVTLDCTGQTILIPADLTASSQAGDARPATG